jgi:DNA-binding LytR/AlgR family response regulator
MKAVSGKLEKAGFIRVHKSFMLHPSFVLQYDISRSLLLLRGGEKLPVSRANRKLVVEKLLSYSC